ncbi:MAG: hypothetical protein E2O61_01475 [Gammaproteobacteria bacterium]|nr:hypothetical protein [Pseudomonadota bacterium]TDJ22876.1 MAG: hypothetical protein E2O59_14755 [Gammaproteobacteria bacterium]TDJ40338.1 MAG: hypothetical protein E2O61_01475 [Gammaproteobacteria bacterium]
MLEMLIIFLLLWLWVIERRLNSLGESVQAIKLDADGMQTVKYLVDSEIAKFRSELGDLHGTNYSGDQQTASSIPVLKSN